MNINSFFNHFQSVLDVNRKKKYIQHKGGDNGFPIHRFQTQVIKKMDLINVELIGTSGDINWIQQSFETMMRTCDLKTMKEIVSHGTDDL